MRIDGWQLFYSIPIALAEGEALQDYDVQRSALGVIINCVCGPIERVGVIIVCLLRVLRKLVRHSWTCFIETLT